MQPRTSVPLGFYPGRGSELFDTLTQRNGVSLSALSGETVLCSFNVPSGTWGILKGFGQGVATSAAWSNIAWTIKISGVPIYPYKDIYDQLSTLTRPVFVFREIRSNDIIQLIGNNVSTSTAYTVYGRILGWYYTGDRSEYEALAEQAGIE